MLRPLLLLLLGSCFLASNAYAAVIGKCSWLDTAEFVQSTPKTFYNGKVTVLHVDSDGEPVCCSSRILIKAKGQCFAFGAENYEDSPGEPPQGFADINFGETVADYDPESGLTLSVLYKIYGEETWSEAPIHIDLTDGVSVYLP